MKKREPKPFDWNDDIVLAKQLELARNTWLDRHRELLLALEGEKVLCSVVGTGEQPLAQSASVASHIAKERERHARLGYEESRDRWLDSQRQKSSASALKLAKSQTRSAWVMVSVTVAILAATAVQTWVQLDSRTQTRAPRASQQISGNR